MVLKDHQIIKKKKLFVVEGKVDKQLFVSYPYEAQGLGTSGKKKIYNTTRGRTHLLAFFLSGRVKLIVTSERLNIYIKCFHQSKAK